MHCDDLSRGFADRTSGNVGPNGVSGHWGHHRCHRFFGGQPITVVVARRDVANVVQIAKHERHR